MICPLVKIEKGDENMDRKIGILHLSDIHASEKNKDILAALIPPIINDLDKNVLNEKIQISAMCLTGDLINSGDNEKQEMEIVFDTVISPLAEHLGLSHENIFIIPGNHEIQRKKIIEYAEQGLRNTLTSEDAIERLTKSGDTSFRSRLSYFDSYSEMFGGQPVFDNVLSRAYIKEFDGFKMGFACVDSSWRSTGIGIEEKGRLIIGKNQIVECLDVLKNTDIKICLMHHPLDWLVEDDRAAIEKCICNFDVVLNGHIHESDTKVTTTFNGQTLFNTCGKLDNSSDIYNGYSVIAINPYNKEADVYLRQYFDFPRNCYDKAIHLNQDGRFSASLGVQNQPLALAYNITRSIKAKFSEYADSYFVPNVIETGTKSGFDDLFIPPMFSEYSEYEKETKLGKSQLGENQKSKISIQELSKIKENIVLLGRRESGKTTALHYIVKHYIECFNFVKKVPILLDCRHIDFAGKDIVPRAAAKFVEEYCDDDTSFSKAQLKELLDAGLCTVIFDCFDEINERGLDKINEFVLTHPNNRFIFSEKETVSATGIGDIKISPKCEFKKYYLCLLSKKQIRDIACNSYSVKEEREKAAFVDNVIQCFANTALPRTPFILSIILSICDSSGYSSINEAVVLEQFMEQLLGKHLPEEASTYVYDFRAKEDFLIAFVGKMLEKKRFYLMNDEFGTFLLEYHANSGFNIEETHFGHLFFENGVLVKNDGIVMFRYSCMNEYYIAKRAKEDAGFLKMLLDNKEYLNFPNEIALYTGLNRRSGDVLQIIQNDLIAYIDKLEPIKEQLDEYDINLEIYLPENAFEAEKKPKRLTQEQCDQLSDVVPTRDPEKPKEITEHKNRGLIPDFLDTFLIFGSCLKNLEFINVGDKKTAFAIYLKCLSIILALMKSYIEEEFQEKLLEVANDPGDSTPETIKDLKEAFNDSIRIVLPIALQNLAYENVGTIKLRSILELSLQQKDQTPFDVFFTTFILCDLRVPNIETTLKTVIAKTDDENMLKIIFFKLFYYYQLRFFGSKYESVLENELAEISLKLQKLSKFNKSKMIQTLREKRKDNSALFAM